jgi:HlyD family secretion protein
MSGHSPVPTRAIRHRDTRVPSATRRARAATFASLSLVLVGCRSDEPDAYGNFEATAVVVSAEVGGQLLDFAVTEGSGIAAGAVVGQIDTAQLALQIAELEAQRSVMQAQTGQAGAQVAALEAQLRGADLELARTRRLYDAEAATARQLDVAITQVETLRAQILAARQQTVGASEQTGGAEARIALLRDRVQRSHIRNPVTGTVLTTFVTAGESVQPGQPLYRIANLDTLEIQAYITGSQLAGVRIGQQVEVRFEGSEGGSDGSLESRPGVVTWIAAEAEFTPTPIQTRDDRADLVYAIKARVPNPDGVLKIGMPGEIVFGARVDGG